MSVLFIENHDSFSFNLMDYLRRLGVTVEIRDHLEEPNLSGISHLVLGPGPGTPKTSGLLMQWLDTGVRAGLPILGICLGHQAIGEYFGAKLIRAPRAVHGEAHEITHSGLRLFAGVPNPTPATRYHSLVLSELPNVLIQEAQSEDGQVMAISHRDKPIYGLQFHPESFLSQDGLAILRNFLLA
ncbi:MAG: aminodeoxychorismate/anthranilate synthase component II [Myxococcaceae bacterium]